MIENNYQFLILDRLLKKYHKRKMQFGEIKNSRRIMLKITEIERNYEKPDADIYTKGFVNDAVRDLINLQYIIADYLPYSDDVVKIYLNEAKIEDIELYMEKQFGIAARQYMLSDMQSLLEAYEKKGILTDYYVQKLRYEMENSVSDMDTDKERSVLELLNFIQYNQRELYVREVSMLVFGDSKHWENNRYDNICSIIREAIQMPLHEDEPNDEVLRQFHISNVEQEICLKGDFEIQIGNYCLKTRHFDGGLSLSSKDIAKINHIQVHTGNVMTIENKTSFCRFKDADYSTIYLGGYAGRHQIEFLKKVYKDNTDCTYWHFGDIDIGGFLIHQHLCKATGISFSLFHMGVEELEDERYRKSLHPLTENDMARAQKLKENPEYREIISALLQKNVKLEQEIISYVLECPQ